ncbi:MAG: carboxypeptidase-like regulatory domain-containing protein, partial [Cyclobacteriaceae bacterium]|nr:carboxypeptidase-like regulatory domain-containing protein [Cyclobacteriaceae bacterium]
MKKLFALVVFTVSANLVFGQKFSVAGQVVDTLMAPLPSATVMLLAPADSSLVNFGVTDGKGFFEIKNVNRGEYWLKITFVGYASFQKKISAEGTP